MYNFVQKYFAQIVHFGIDNNKQDYFYIDSLENKYPLSKFNEYIT